MNKAVKIGLYGFLTWLIPFIIAFFFYSKDGQVIIDIFLFKNIMTIIGSLVGAVLLILYFNKVEKEYLKEGVVLGVVWLGMNLILDLLILLPMSGMGVGIYFTQTGLKYIAIPITSIAMGLVLQNHERRRI